MMNIPGNPVGASQRLLTRLGGGFILRVHTTSQLISSLIGPLVGIYFVYITARLSGLQLIQLVISTVCFIVLVDFLHYFYARRITRQARAYLDHIFLKKSLPEARKESVSWEQILTLPRRSAVAQLIQVSLLVVFPVSLFMVWVGYVDWNQVILIVIGGFLAGMAVVIQSILYLDRQLAPARRSLLPAELSPETTLIGVGQRTRQYFVISVLLLSAILAIGALGYQYIYMAGIRGADPTLVLAQYQTQLLVLGLIIFVLGIFLSSYMVRSQFQTTQELIRVMERVKGGAYSERAQIIASDETAILTVRLNQLLDQLQTSRVAMEEQVKERTQALERRSLQLQAVTQIAGEVASIPDLGTLLTRNSPLTAIQLLWLNLITDGAPALALGTEKGDPDIMSQPPRPPKEPIINRFMQFGILTQTIAITGVTLAAYFFGLKLHPAQPEFAESMAFITLSASELFRAYTSRSERYPLFKIGIFTNRNMNLAFLSSMILLLAVVYVPFLNKIFNTVPMGWQQWEVMLPLLLIPSVVAEMVKYIVSRKKTA